MTRFYEFGRLTYQLEQSWPLSHHATYMQWLLQQMRNAIETGVLISEFEEKNGE